MVLISEAGLEYIFGHTDRCMNSVSAAASNQPNQPPRRAAEEVLQYSALLQAVLTLLLWVRSYLCVVVGKFHPVCMYV